MATQEAIKLPRSKGAFNVPSNSRIPDRQPRRPDLHRDYLGQVEGRSSGSQVGERRLVPHHLGGDAVSAVERFQAGYADGVAGMAGGLKANNTTPAYDRVFARGFWCGYHDRRQGKAADPARSWAQCAYLHGEQ